MTELTQEQQLPKQSLWQRLRENPITMKELRGRMRGRRAFVVLTVYLLLMSAFIALVYLAYASASSGPFGPDPRGAGKTIFACVVGVQVFVVLFIGPSFTVGTVTGEKERQTFDLLRTTLLSSKNFVFGKLLSALSYVLLLIFAAIPLQSIAFLLGGVTLSELLLSQLVLVVGAITFAMWGLYCSSAMRSTQAASVVTFAGALFVTGGIPILAFLAGIILGPLFIASSANWILEATVFYIGIFLSATNLPATLVVSDLILLQEDTLFFFNQSFSGITLWYVSPWPLFLIIYAIMALILYFAAVRRVRKIANQ